MAPELWQEPLAGWVEVWRDDFDGPAESAPDPERWTLEVREQGFNKELNYNTGDRKNSLQDGTGNLAIRALAEHHIDANGVESTQPYSSARLNTQGKFAQQYGRFEARIKLPAGGRGVWPAFWMLGDNIDTAGWPDCGEVDILEMRGSKPGTIISSLHGPGYSGGNAYNNSYDLEGGSFGDAFHVFTFEWTPEAVRWLVDGEQFYVKTPEALHRQGLTWAYDRPFFMILNLAIGGIFDGNPDAATVFPQEMLIDYVSVSQLKSEM